MISTHILDTSLGQPASGVQVELEMLTAGAWTALSIQNTNSDGRIQFQIASVPGTYRLHFQLKPYFKRSGTPVFFPSAHVLFEVNDVTRKYHIPLLLSPYGYSTYRGS